MYLVTSGGKAGILNKFDDIQRMTMKVMCALIFAGYIILQYFWILTGTVLNKHSDKTASPTEIHQNICHLNHF